METAVVVNPVYWLQLIESLGTIDRTRLSGISNLIDASVTLKGLSSRGAKPKIDVGDYVAIIRIETQGDGTNRPCGQRVSAGRRDFDNTAG